MPDGNSGVDEGVMLGEGLVVGVDVGVGVMVGCGIELTALKYVPKAVLLAKFMS